MGMIFTAIVALLLLVQLLTGKAFVDGSASLTRRRLRERPGAKIWWGPIWVRRDENPSFYWMTTICYALLLLVLVRKFLVKLPWSG